MHLFFYSYFCSSHLPTPEIDGLGLPEGKLAAQQILCEEYDIDDFFFHVWEPSGSCFYVLLAHSMPFLPGSRFYGPSIFAIHEMCSILFSLCFLKTAFARFPELHFFANQGTLGTAEFIALVPLIASCDGSRVPVKWCVCPGTHCTPAAVRDCYSTHNNYIIVITNHLLQTPDLTTNVMLYTSLKLTPPASFLLQAKSPLQTGQHKPKVRDGLRPVRSTSLQPDTISIHQAIRTQILLKNHF